MLLRHGVARKLSLQVEMREGEAIPTGSLVESHSSEYTLTVNEVHPYELLYLNTWSVLGSAVWEGYRIPAEEGHQVE